MTPDEHKAIIRRYVDTVFNQQQLDRADETVASDFVDHAALAGQAGGLTGAKQKWAMFHAAIPDLRVTIEDMVADGEKVAVRRELPGHSSGSVVWRTGHREAIPDRWLQHLPHCRRKDHRALGTAGSAGAHAATRRYPDTRATRTVGDLAERASVPAPRWRTADHAERRSRHGARYIDQDTSAYARRTFRSRLAPTTGGAAPGRPPVRTAVVYRTRGRRGTSVSRHGDSGRPVRSLETPHGGRSAACRCPR
jgi:predicted ester cyclase